MNERAVVGGECASSCGVSSGGWLCLKTSIERQNGDDNKPAQGVVHTVKENFSHGVDYHLPTEMDAIASGSVERDIAVHQERTAAGEE